ncbi:DJ-1/PfpI family protein [uncultured Anaerococcus sp.]|uniref:DJ-1/PfpI family protein n=1 Tax=uncultured Anaerococcus sp. TaxID=293428 RepID=UPI0025DED1E9|nr:DJ-1/PfpI family protein [uncultured Anaerococcus sp.]
MKTVYIYLLDGMAEFEIGYILQAFSMEKLLKNGSNDFEVKTVAFEKKTILTLGGLKITPDYSLSEVDFDDAVALLLPGSSNWEDEKNKQILKKAQKFLDENILVGAICGATLAIADCGVLNKFKHTSNSLEYLTNFSKEYKGQKYYINSKSVVDRNLITASTAGSLEWAADILNSLKVYPSSKVKEFYDFYSTGDSKYYKQLMK